jgi:hypothetical protein
MNPVSRVSAKWYSSRYSHSKVCNRLHRSLWTEFGTRLIDFGRFSCAAENFQRERRRRPRAKVNALYDNSKHNWDVSFSWGLVHIWNPIHRRQHRLLFRCENYLWHMVQRGMYKITIMKPQNYVQITISACSWLVSLLKLLQLGAARLALERVFILLRLLHLR